MSGGRLIGILLLVRQSFPAEITELIPILNRSYTAEFPPDERLSEEEHPEVIRKWNDGWDRYSTARKVLPPSMAGYSFQFRDLHGISLSNANLQSDDEEHDPDHQGANLSEAKFNGANLAGVNLTHASLDRANLREAHLTRASLKDANLRDADLSYADLRGADLTSADLTGAMLHGTNLEGALLLQAKFDYADLRLVRGMILDENSIYRTKFTNRSGLIWQGYLLLFGALRWLNRKLSFGVHDASLDFPLFVEDS